MSSATGRRISRGSDGVRSVEVSMVGCRDESEYVDQERLLYKSCDVLVEVRTWPKSKCCAASLIEQTWPLATRVYNQHSLTIPLHP